MNVHANLQLGTMNMTMIFSHITQLSNPFHTVPTTIFSIVSEKFNEYAAAIRNALNSSPKRKLTSEQLRKEAELPAGKLLPVTEEMIKDGELYVSLDYSTQPPSHLYSLTPKGKAKL